MLNEATQFALLWGALGGIIGSFAHILTNSKLRKELTDSDFQRREYVNVVVWMTVAVLAGMLTGLENPALGLFAGLATGYLGSDGLSKLMLAINTDEKLKQAIRLNLGEKSLAAIKELLERLDFIKGIDIKDRLGQIDITIFPEPIWNPDKHLGVINSMLSALRPLGVIFNLIEPKQLLVNITGSITVKDGRDEAAILAEAKEVMTVFINSHTLGEAVRLNALKAKFVTGTVPDVIDTEELNANGQITVLPVPADQVARVGTITLSVKRLP